MSENRKFNGILAILIGLTLVSFLSLFREVIEDMTINTNYNVVTLNIINMMGPIFRIIGVIEIMIGIFNLVISIVNPYGYSYEPYNHSENALVFWILNGKKKKDIYVKLDNLSDSTVKVLREKIERPLKNLYDVANNGKRAKEEYKNCEIYITSLAEDLKQAIDQCENELMEQKLLDKLYIIEDAIKNIRDRVNEAIATDKDEEKFLKELKLESFEPFTITENINKLEDDYVENESKYDNFTSAKTTEGMSFETKKDILDSFKTTNEIYTTEQKCDYGSSIWNDWN